MFFIFFTVFLSHFDWTNSSRNEMENETLPLQLAEEIAKNLFIKSKKVEKKEVLEEFEKILGNDFLKVNNFFYICNQPY